MHYKIKRSLLALSTLATISLAGMTKADLVTEWNAVALRAIRTAGTNPPVATRNLAMTHTAIFDAIESIDRSYRPYFYNGYAPNASREAAVSVAAYTVLSNLYPSQEATFRATRDLQLGNIASGASKTEGMTLGANVGQGMIARRTGDGSVNTLAPYMGNTNIGQWRPTPGANLPGLLPNWPTVTPWAMSSGSAFRPGPPPAIGTAQYLADYNQVKAIGASNSATRTPEQTLIARYWADGGGTVTPPGHWNRIAQTVSTAQGNSLSQNARLFALLNIGLADAAIAVWDAKYAYNCWRPITAIREGDNDGNPLTVGDASWSPLITTPNFASYSSGHSAFSAVGSRILGAFFGTDNIAFSDTSDFNNTVRNFSSFSQAADEAGWSRIYGGIHFAFDDSTSRQIGNQVSDYVLRTQFAAVPEPGTLALLLGAGVTGIGLLRRRKR